MTTTAQSIIKRATDLIQDQTSVRWPAEELVRWLNDAQREVALYRPDTLATFGAITLAAGTRQTLPAGGFKLIDVPNNTAGTKAAIRQVERGILDEQLPGWHGLTGTAIVVHFMYDVRDPRTFYVYPPSSGGNQVNAVYAVYPTNIAEPPAASTYDDVTGDIGVPDIFASALLDYVVYRAFSKDSQHTVNAARAETHYRAFANALGIDAAGTAAVAPRPKRPGASGNQAPAAA